MVERGQLLERMTIVRAHDGALLEALFCPGVRRADGAPAASPVALAAPHPELGGSMDSAVLAEIVWALGGAGHPTLRFNWRGVGASPGKASADLDEAARDLLAAVDQHAATSVVGYSFGAAVAARAALTHDKIERVVLIAPPVDAFAFDFKALQASGTQVAVFAGALDTLAPPERVRLALKDGGAEFGVHEISGASHGFIAGLAELGRLVSSSIP